MGTPQKKQAGKQAEQLKKLQQENHELVLHLQRLQAEFDNYRKRTERQLAEQSEKAADKLIREILPIMDNLSLAKEHAGEDANNELLKAMLMIQDQLKNMLEDQGIEEIPSSGAFNPALHEAMFTVDSKKKAGEIEQTIQKGYTRGGRILRAAKVSVAK